MTTLHDFGVPMSVLMRHLLQKEQFRTGSGIQYSLRGRPSVLWGA